MRKNSHTTRMLRDFEGWPSQSADESKLQAAVTFHVLPVKENTVCFKVIAQGIKHDVCFEAPTEEIAKKVKRILENHLGSTVWELGKLAVSM